MSDLMRLERDYLLDLIGRVDRTLRRKIHPEIIVNDLHGVMNEWSPKAMQRQLDPEGYRRWLASLPIPTILIW